MLRMSRGNRVLIPVLGLVALALAPTAVRAQNATATIEGKVTDESGGVLPGVTVTATSPALQLPQVSTVTGANGEYELRDLPAPGVYRVSFELAGFQTHARAELNLMVGFSARVDIEMGLGAVSETVEVSGQSPVVDVTNATRATSLVTAELEALPRAKTMQEMFPLVAGLSSSSKPDVGDSNLAQQSPWQTYGASLMPTLNVEGVDIHSNNTFSTGMYMSSYNFSEVQFKTTGNNADVAKPGFAMEAVVKSGGNDFHGIFQTDYENADWQANNVTPELAAQGLRFTNPLRKYWAAAADVGGRVLRDRLWFYTAYSKQHQTTGLLGFIAGPNAQGCYTCLDAPTADVVSELPQGTGKVNAQLSQNVRLNGVYVQTAKYLDPSGANATTPLPSTRPQNHRVILWKTELNWTPSSHMALNLLLGQNKSWSKYNPQPGMDVAGQPTSLEQTTRIRTGVAEIPYEARPSFGNPVIANLSYFTARHQLKIGMDLNREGRNTEAKRGKDAGDYQLTFNRGLPFQITTYNFPVGNENRLNRQAVYAMDTWRLDRLTLSFGVRMSHYRAFYPDQTKPAGQLSPAADYVGQDILTWSDIVPRVGGSFDVLGSGKTVVKGTFGKFGDTMGSEYAGDFNPNGITSTIYRWDGPCVPIAFKNVSFNNTGCDVSPAFVRSLNPSSPLYVSATGGINQRVNKDLKQPKTYEFTARIEQELIPNVAVSAGVVRYQINFGYGTITPLRPYSAYSVAVPLVDPATGQSVSIYTYPSAFAGAAFNPTQHESASGDRPDVNTTFEVAITKRYSKRWNGSASYWITKNDKYLTATRTPANPNEDAFPKDETNSWEARGAVMYSAPLGIQVSGTYRAQSGFKGQRTVSFTSPLLLQGAVTRRMEPLGAQMTPAITLLSLKVSKVFSLGGVRKLEINGQGFNLLNSSSATAVNYLTGVTFARVTGIVNPRVGRIGAEFRF